MITTIKIDLKQYQQHIIDHMQQHRKRYLVETMLITMIGLAGLFAPIAAAEISVFLLGTILLASGLTHSYFNLRLRRAWWFYIPSGLFSILGALIMAWPDKGSIVLATLIGMFLLLKGLIDIILASLLAPQRGWLWVLANGLLTLLLAAFIGASWPQTAVWFLGIAIALNMLLFGITMYSYIARLPSDQAKNRNSG